MIRGYFLTRGDRLRPFVDAIVEIPGVSRALDVTLLVDTGADYTVLAPLDAVRLSSRLGIDVAALPQGNPSAGVGGWVETRTIDAVLTLGSFSMSLTITILEAPTGPLAPIPSLLGRDVIAHFALFMEERTRRVLLLEPAEVAALPLP